MHVILRVTSYSRVGGENQLCCPQNKSPGHTHGTRCVRMEVSALCYVHECAQDILLTVDPYPSRRDHVENIAKLVID